MQRIESKVMLLILSLLMIGLFTACEQGPKPPNIIYIMTDDLGYGDLGCYGQEQIQTPNIDKLASEGMRFTDHYSGHTVCRPSRLVLWTGYHTGHTAISANQPYVFKPEDTTVAELLQQAGYKTGGVGKWAMGDTSNSGHPNLNGFDFWMGYLNQSNAHNYYPTHLWRNYEKVALAGNELSDDPMARGRVAVKRTTYSHDVMTEEALEFIRRNANDPFLLHVHWTIPHANNEGGRVTGDGMEVPDYGIYKDEEWPNTARGQAAMISRMDRDVGRLMALLKELNIDQNTIVFFSSDNGPHSEGGHDHKFFNSNGPLRGYKRDLYEGGIRIPLIARWPGHIEPNTTSKHPSAFWDYLPTACEIAGVEIPEGIDGKSYLPTLVGQQQEQHQYLYWKFKGNNHNKFAVRTGKWKAVSPNPNSGVELYDLSVDPGEENNLAAEKSDMVDRMMRMALHATR